MIGVLSARSEWGACRPLSCNQTITIWTAEPRLHTSPRGGAPRRELRLCHLHLNWLFISSLFSVLLHNFTPPLRSPLRSKRTLTFNTAALMLNAQVRGSTWHWSNSIILQPSQSPPPAPQIAVSVIPVHRITPNLTNLKHSLVLTEVFSLNLSVNLSNALTALRVEHVESHFTFVYTLGRYSSLADSGHGVSEWSKKETTNTF
jgi:hypothetical protein